MRKIFAIALTLSAAILSAQEFRAGSKIADFQVRDLDGKAVWFSSLKGPITVVTFIATQCPVSNSYNQRMIELYQDYTPKNVKFIFVNANRSEHARRVGFSFPVYKDPDNVVADRFDAQVTPESYVIDGSGILRYHGSIDDNMNAARVRTQRLRQALDALLGGKLVPAIRNQSIRLHQQMRSPGVLRKVS